MRSFDEMNRMFDEMNRSFDQFRMGWSAGAPALESGHDADRWMAPEAESALSLAEGDGEYVLVMDVPGFEREEIDLAFAEGSLSVHATHDIEEEIGTAHTARSRRISRTVPVPGTVDEEGITASYRNGVLEVRLPMEDDGEGHRIEIE